MTTLAHPRQDAPAATALRPGDRLDQADFHARYEVAPEPRAELINGVVWMASPLSRDHGGASVALIAWLAYYAELTPGVEPLDNATVILDGRNEVQPDATLRIRPGCGGGTRDEGGYVAGAPELVVEVAGASRYVDLGPKFDEYQRAGVREYLVRSLGPDEVLWFALRDGRYEPIAADGDGLIRSRAFPGLWLDPSALFAGDGRGLRRGVDLGAATAEHAAFVGALARAGGATAPDA
jgi:Uma2 family endonuclease